MPQDLMQINEGIVYLIVVIVGVIIWFSRLESKVSNSTSDIVRLQSRQDLHEQKLTELDNRVMDKLVVIEKALSRIEGSLQR